MEIRAIIADDEALARSKLRILLQSEPDLRIVAECANGLETMEAVRTYRPDLLLLDVEMPEIGGFEVLQALEAEETPFVIFTTAYNDYAVRAFEAEALDYLLKPFAEERLQEAIGRARQQLALHEGIVSPQRLREFLARAPSRTGSATGLRWSGSLTSTKDVDQSMREKNVVAADALRSRRVGLETINPCPEPLEAVPVPHHGIEGGEQPHLMIRSVILMLPFPRPAPLDAIHPRLREPFLCALNGGRQFIIPLRHRNAQAAQQKSQ